MIRVVTLQDAQAIADIYNEYVINTTITFETEPVSVEDMQNRIHTLSSRFPYFVYEEEGQVIGYCYAHHWKERAAYRYTLETTVYLAPQSIGKGIGVVLMNKLIEACKEQDYHSLIACITTGNQASNHLHAKLGFKQVSHYKEVGLKFGRWLDVIDYELIISQNRNRE